MTSELELREAERLLRAGERERAKALLIRVVRTEPTSVAGWLLLAGAVNEPAQRRDCLERVLRLQPDHPAARRAMAVLDRQPPQQAAPLTPREQPRPVTPAPALATTVAAPVAAATTVAATPLAATTTVATLVPPPAPTAPPTPTAPAAAATTVAAVVPSPTPVTTTPAVATTVVAPPAVATIALSEAAVAERRRERQLWTAVLAAGVLLMLIGLAMAAWVLAAS